jgi:hypothetical protein
LTAFAGYDLYFKHFKLNKLPLSPNFSAAQTLGESSEINFVDTSTGSDAGILSRRIYLQKTGGGFLVETGTTTDYEVWAYASTTKTLDVLDKDYGLTITVEWRGVSEALLYSKQYVLGFTLFNETFDYQLTQILAGNPLLINDNNFLQNKSDLRTYIDAGNQAIEFASDTYNAQQAYDKATAIRLQSQYFFNANS